jgi:hypothetical protein
MSRVRMALLSSLVVVAAVPSGAQAKTSKYCKLFSPAEVGRSVHKSGVSMTTSSMRLQATASKAMGRLNLCTYSTGADEVAETTVFTLPKGSGSPGELKNQVRIRAGQTRLKPKKVSGPWTLGYQIGPMEIYVVKGTHIFHMLYIQKPSGNAPLQFATRAARKL